MEKLSSIGYGKLFIISGPSCVGKTTLVSGFLRHHPEYSLRRIVTCTTRPPRTNEIDGQDYHFLSLEKFEQKIQAGAFLEYTKIYGTHFYGTLADSVIHFLKKEHLFLTIDIQGTQSIFRSYLRFPVLAGRCTSIFLKLDDLKILKQRLQRRKDSIDEIARRIKSASTELNYADHYNYIISSRTIEENEEALHAIYKKETGICASPEEGLEVSY
jgi:guanylate kinase